MVLWRDGASPRRHGLSPRISRAPLLDINVNLYFGLFSIVFRRHLSVAVKARVKAWRAPGRVNLIGEHTDYNLGFVLPFALGLGASCG